MKSICPSVLLIGMLPAIATAAGASPPAELAGTFRYSVGRVAPWVAQARLADVRATIPLLQGRDIRFARRVVDSPAPLACASARYQSLSIPAANLFGGRLPKPADDAAKLGLPSTAIVTVRITCSDTGYDVHRAADHQWLVALDDVIWTLDRSPGARVLPDRPEHPVQLLLEGHLMSDMAFSRESGWRLIQRATAALAAAVKAALAATRSTDDAPPIKGDPITDSHESPARFAVGTADIDGATARVPVTYADGLRERRIIFVLDGSTGAWKIDDIDYGDGRSLRTLLAEHVAPGSD